MRVLLVRPHINKKITTVKKFMFGEPMGIECVSTILKEQGHHVLLVDFMAESHRHLKKYIKKFKPDVVGLTSQCSDITNVLYLAEKTKKIDCNIKVVVGGIASSPAPISTGCDCAEKIAALEAKVAALEGFVKALQADGYLTLANIKKAAADACPVEASAE
jgi:hypothetical protein